MVSTDPIADMLTRIRNAAMVRQNTVRVPYSKMKESVANILVEQHFLVSSVVDETTGSKQLLITINREAENSVFTEIKRLSRPGRRLYTGVNEIPVVKRGRGIVVVSTSQGVMTGDQAKAKRLGGELICQVY